MTKKKAVIISETAQTKETVVAVLTARFPKWMEDIEATDDQKQVIKEALEARNALDPAIGVHVLRQSLFSVLRDLYVDTTGNKDFHPFITAYHKAANAV